MKAADPVYLSARKEMGMVFGVWALFCTWVVGYCNLNAYSLPQESVELVFGMPSWVFWGIAVPWCSATAVSILIAMFFMKDHDLESIEPVIIESTDEKTGSAA